MSWTLISVSEFLLDENEGDEYMVKDDIAFRSDLQKRAL